MRNESFAMLNQKKKREKFIGVLNFKCNGLLSREEMEFITDSIDSGRQYSVRLFFDSERFKALSMEKGQISRTATIPQSKTVIHFGAFFSRSRNSRMARTSQLADMLIFTTVRKNSVIMILLSDSGQSSAVRHQFQNRKACDAW